MDLSLIELEKAFGQPFCPLCRVLRIAEERQIWSYLYEQSMDPVSRRQFDAALGFCRDHAVLAATVVQERELVSGATLALLYESIAQVPHAAPKALCPACEVAQARARGEILAFTRILDTHWEAYEKSEGLCLPHFGIVLGSAKLEEDQRRRMKSLRTHLRELHRKRAHDALEPPTPEERGSWREALWRFTGVHWDGPLVKRR